MALEFAVDVGFSELIIEGDNVNVMKAILSTRVDYSHLGHISLKQKWTMVTKLFVIICSYFVTEYI